jgi:DNA primase
MISPETIALVKERTDLAALIGETVRLTRRGRSFVGLCPFHKEKSPSFHVSADRGWFHCFGCKESGDAIAFLEKVEGHTFSEAVRVLAERAGVEITENVTDAERREATAARRSRDDLYLVNNLAATFYERCLRGSSTGGAPSPLAHYAEEELGRRGLQLPPSGSATDPVADTLQAFRIGYAPHGWDNLALFLKQQGISPVVAEKVGLLVPRAHGGGHYDRFRHRLMFPVIDVQGRVIAFSGRALPDPTPDELGDSRAATSAGEGGEQNKPAKYINSPESPIYTKGEHLFGLYQARQTLRQKGEATLVEGNFDVVSLHARGIQNVIAPLGTAFTVSQAKLLKRFCPMIIVLFDGDAAGKKATRASRDACRDGGLAAKVAVLAAGLDPDELVRRSGPEAIGRVVKAARGMLEYLFEDALDSETFGQISLSEQRARVRVVEELLAGEDDPNLRLMAKLYADKLASKLIIQGQAPTDLRFLERLVEQATSRTAVAPQAASTTTVPAARARSRAQIEEIGLAMVAAILDFPDLLGDPDVEDGLGMLEGDAALAIAAARQTRHGEMGILVPEFLARVPPSIQAFAARRLAGQTITSADSLVSLDSEVIGETKVQLLKNARKLKRLSLLRENAGVVDRLHRAETLKDVASEDALLLESVRRAREKHRLL